MVQVGHFLSRAWSDGHVEFSTEGVSRAGLEVRVFSRILIGY